MKKLFLFSFFPLLATFIVPLTSCAQATYYFMPLAIYGQSIFDPTTLSDHYDLNKYNSSSFKQTSPDKALFNMSDLSVNKFIVDENDGSSWIYSRPNAFKDDKIEPTESFNWNLPFYFESKLKNGLYDSKNFGLIALNNSVKTISSSISNYFKTFLTFLSQPAIATNPHKENRETWLNALFGTHPQISTPTTSTDAKLINYESKNFYDFIFSNINSFSLSDSLKFDIDSIDFSFASNYFGPGPLISLGYDTINSNFIETNVKNILYSTQLYNILSDTGGYYQTPSNHKIYIGANTDSEITAADVNTHLNTAGNDAIFNPKRINYLTSTATDTKGKITSSTFTMPVPILINAKNANFGFYNYKDIKHSINPNDWLESSEKVNSVAKKCPSWKNYKNFAKTDIDVNCKTIDVKTNSSLPWYVSDSGTVQTPNNLKDSVSTTNGYDIFVSKLCDLTTPANFVGFAYYNVFVDNDESSGNTHLFPYLSSVSSIVPFWTLFKINDTGTVAFDDSLFIEYPVEFKYPADPSTPAQKAKFLDPSLVNEKANKKIINFFSKYIKESDKPYNSSLTKQQLIDRVYAITAFTSMFGTKPTSTPSTTDASNMFSEIK